MYEIHSYVQIYIILYTYVNCVVVFWLLCCQHARPPLQRLAFAERLTISWTQKTGADRMTEVGRNGMVPTRWGFLVVRWLTGAFYAGNGWEWRLLGWLLIVIVDHSRKFPAFSTSKFLESNNWHRKSEVIPSISRKYSWNLPHILSLKISYIIDDLRHIRHIWIHMTYHKSSQASPNFINH